MSGGSEDEIARRVHAALSQTEVPPMQVIPDNARHLRPKYNPRTNKVTVQDDSSLSSVTSLGDLPTSSSRSGERSSKKEEGGGFKILGIDWKWIALGVIVLVLLIFLYRKWTIIRNLGVGYSVASVPGLETVGAKLAGVPAQQAQDELKLLESGQHPGVQKDSKPAVTTTTVQPKDEVIDKMLEKVEVKQTEEAKPQEEVKPLPPPQPKAKRQTRRQAAVAAAVAEKVEQQPKVEPASEQSEEFVIE